MHETGRSPTDSQSPWYHRLASSPAGITCPGSRKSVCPARAGWVQALPTTWGTDAACTAGLPTLVRAGHTLFRLPGVVIPAGDARRWYQGLCESVGLRPVACYEGTGTQNRAYNAVPLLASPFSCQVGTYITAQSGWPATITIYQGDMGRGSGLSQDGGASTAGETGHPICTDHA